jgi:hypothetical protein
MEWQLLNERLKNKTNSSKGAPMRNKQAHNCDQLHAPATLPLWKSRGTYRTEGWVDHRSVMMFRWVQGGGDLRNTSKKDEFSY